MDNEQRKINERRKAGNGGANVAPQQSRESARSEELWEETQGRDEVQGRTESEMPGARKLLDKPLKIAGTLCLVAGIIGFVFTDTSNVDSSGSAQNALANKVSTTVSAGTILLAKDENIGQKDYTITHKSDVKDTKIWVWDYAAEDGDYVQVLVNGTPLGDSFMIKHKPVELTVPAVGEVQIKGIRDGGGGITYGVRYDVNGTSYFNGAPDGELNTYTLIKE